MCNQHMCAHQCGQHAHALNAAGTHARLQSSPCGHKLPCSSLPGPSCVFFPFPLHGRTLWMLLCLSAGLGAPEPLPLVQPLPLEGPGGEYLEKMGLEGLCGGES